MFIYKTCFIFILMLAPKRFKKTVQVHIEWYFVQVHVGWYFSLLSLEYEADIGGC